MTERTTDTDPLAVVEKGAGNCPFLLYTQINIHMTDTVLPTKHWKDPDFLYNVFDDKILVLDFLTLHEYNQADLKDGSATLYNRIKEAIQVAQTKDTNATWKYVVIDNSIESMSSFSRTQNMILLSSPNVLLQN